MARSVFRPLQSPPSDPKPDIAQPTTQNTVSRIDPNLEKQLKDYVDQYKSFRWGQYKSAKDSGDEGSASQNLQFYQNAPKDLEGVLNTAKQFGLGVDKLPLLKGAISGAGGPTDQQAYNEFINAQTQIQKQNQQLEDFRNRYITQEFGDKNNTLQQALSGSQGDLAQLNQFLGSQEAQTFNTQLKPLIQMALGAQGLSDSGAQVELQSKALAQLEQQRQQSMMSAALGVRSQAQALEQSNIMGDIGAQNSAISNMADLQRSGITMQFQMQLEQQREQLARELAGRHGGGGMGALAGTLGGAAIGAIGFASGNPMVGLAGMGVGSMLGGSIGGFLDPNQNNAALGGIPSAFFAGANLMNSNRSTMGGGQAGQAGQGLGNYYQGYGSRSGYGYGMGGYPGGLSGALR